MKRYRLNQLPDNREGHILSGLIPGKYIYQGIMSYKAPGFRTHAEGNHRHSDEEVFIIMQGKATMEVDGKVYPMVTGDVFVIEPGEEHYLTADEEDPCINIWFHAGPNRHPDQLKK